MRILGFGNNKETKNNRKAPAAQRAPECSNHGVMTWQDGQYVCLRPGCFTAKS